MDTVKDEHLDYLNELEEWGVKDMSNALPILQQKFPELSLEEARQVLKKWSATRYQQLDEGLCRS